MFTAADWLIIAVLLISALVSLLRGFIKEVVSVVGWIAAFIVTSKFYSLLAPKLTFVDDDIVRSAIACLILFFATLIVVGLCGSILSSIISKVGLSGTDRLLGMVFGVIRGTLIVCVILVLFQIGLKLHILSFAADAPFYRDSLLIPEFQRIINWFFTTGPLQNVDQESLSSAISDKFN